MATQAEATLLPKVGVWTGRQAVGLATGYIQPDKPGAKRTQVVVVLTNGWTVLLFDHNLRLQWESTVRDQFDRNFYHRCTPHLFHNAHSHYPMRPQ